MKETLLILICTLPSIACAVGAILLALNNIDGWGWFIFSTLLLSDLYIKIQND